VPDVVSCFSAMSARMRLEQLDDLDNNLSVLIMTCPTGQPDRLARLHDIGTDASYLKSAHTPCGS
jgi:hypothetical protein